MTEECRELLEEIASREDSCITLADHAKVERCFPEIKKQYPDAIIVECGNVQCIVGTKRGRNILKKRNQKLKAERKLMLEQLNKILQILEEADSSRSSRIQVRKTSMNRNMTEECRELLEEIASKEDSYITLADHAKTERCFPEIKKQYPDAVMVEYEKAQCIAGTKRGRDLLKKRIQELKADRELILEQLNKTLQILEETE